MPQNYRISRRENHKSLFDAKKRYNRNIEYK